MYICKVGNSTNMYHFITLPSKLNIDPITLFLLCFYFQYVYAFPSLWG